MNARRKVELCRCCCPSGTECSGWKIKPLAKQQHLSGLWFSALHAPWTATRRQASEKFSKLVFVLLQEIDRLTATDYWNKWNVLTGDVLAVDLIAFIDTYIYDGSDDSPNDDGT